MWIKGNEKIDGSHLVWKDKQGNEFETWNPTDEFLEEQGWTKEIDPDSEEVHVKTLRELKDEIIQECNEFYKSVILKVSFHGELLWIPADVRTTYKMILEDALSEGFTWTEYRDYSITVCDALNALKAMNVYEFNCRSIRDNHVKAIIRKISRESLESYDYTEGYPDKLELS